MIRFKNALLEEVCQNMLTPDENRIKIVSSPTGNHLIVADKSALKLLRSHISDLEQGLAAARKAETLILLALQLGGDVKEVED